MPSTNTVGRSLSYTDFPHCLVFSPIPHPPSPHCVNLLSKDGSLFQMNSVSSRYHQCPIRVFSGQFSDHLHLPCAVPACGFLPPAPAFLGLRTVLGCRRIFGHTQGTGTRPQPKKKRNFPASLPD